MIEILLFILAMLIGFTLDMLVFKGCLIAAFKRSNNNYNEYKIRTSAIMKLLEGWNTDAKLMTKTTEFFDVFWEKRNGVSSMPAIFQRLPVAVQKEVTVDMFWNAMRHSHIFAGLDMSFKRSVSFMMRNEFLLPGHFLYKRGELKSKMVYVVSGVLQVNSKLNDTLCIVVIYFRFYLQKTMNHPSYLFPPEHLSAKLTV